MLEEYVDLSCLPDEFGGYDGFNVNEWVEYTTVNPQTIKFYLVCL